MHQDLSRVLAMLMGVDQVVTICSLGLTLAGAVIIRSFWRRGLSPWDT